MHLLLLYLILKVEKGVGKVFQAATAVSGSILKKKVPNEKVVLLETENLEASIGRSDRDKMNGSTVQFSTESNSKVQFPSAFDLGIGLKVVDTVVNMHMFFQRRIYTVDRVVYSHIQAFQKKLVGQNLNTVSFVFYIMQVL